MGNADNPMAPDDPQIQKEFRRQEILADIAARKQKEVSQGFDEMHYLNNLVGNLPGGVYRKWAAERGQLHKLPSESGYKKQGAMSDIRWGQSNDAFFQAIDKAINEQGSYDGVVALMDHYNAIQQARGEVDEVQIELYKFMEPMYISLRLLGYSHDDLCA